MQTVFSGSTPAITKLLGETTAPDVRTYIEVSKRTAEKVIRESDLPKLLGVASTSTTATSGGAAACGGTAGMF